MSDKISIQKFNIREADWATEERLLSEIRRLVFVVEQDVASEEEWDDKDKESWHWIATDQDDVPIGTARLLPEGQIGRLAVLDQFRGAGIGAALLERAIDKARHLGFNQVSLNAQIHALAFYERAGFVAISDEFEEAGILHRKMTRTLKPLDDNVQRLEPIDSDSRMTVKQFDTREVAFEVFAKSIMKVREIVFVTELGLPESLVRDDTDNNIDKDAIHWIAEDESGQVIGTLRMTMDGEISRLAVVLEHRHEGIGQSLLELATMKAARLGLTEARLDARAVLDSFYLRAGFSKRGESFDGFGVEHQTYFKTIVIEDVHERLRRPGVKGDLYTDSDVDYKLGESNNLIRLRREEDFKNIILEMTSQSVSSIRIYSPLLEHKLFNAPELREICSALARKNRYTTIEILLYDSHRIVKNGHALLEICRKLPSSIKMKIVHPDYRHLNHEYVLADRAGIIYRLDHDVFDGYANFSDKTECGRLGRQFTAAWESGLIDPDLRQIRI